MTDEKGRRSQPEPGAGRRYDVRVAQVDEARAVASTRGHELTLNVRKGDGRAGFNAAETLLAALGAKPWQTARLQMAQTQKEQI